MNKEYIEKTRKEMGVFEKILSYIPGYRGYKEKEIRRESDRLIRMEVVNELNTVKKIIRRKFANPIIVQKLLNEDSWRLDTLMSRLDRVTQRIDKAIAGYAGVFDAIKVKEDKLDTLFQYDLSLIEKAKSLKNDAERIISMEPGKDEWRNGMDELISKIEEIDGFIDKRSEILKGLIS